MSEPTSALVERYQRWKAENEPVTWISSAEFKRRREAFGCTAREMAERLGVAKRSVNRWEHDRQPPLMAVLALKWLEHTDWRQRLESRSVREAS